MNKESYRILKEINSLNNSILELQSSITEELTRITKIESQRSKKQTLVGLNSDTLKDKRKSLNHFEDRIHYFGDLVEKGNQQIKIVFTEHEISALTKQVENAKVELEIFEDQGLEIMEEMTELEQESSDANQFLEGSLETILEIQNEINEANDGLFKEIQIKKDRLKNLYSQLPSNVVKKLDSLSKKNLALGPLTQITAQNNCEICGYLIPMAILRAVETENKFMGCPGCERVLIPQSSKFL